MIRKEDSRWTTANDIAAAALKLWNSGRLPSSLVSGENIFPFTVKINGPSSSEMAEQIGSIRAWSAELEARSNKTRRHSYSLEYRHVNHRVIGENDIPSRAVIENADEALALAGKAGEAKLLTNLADETAERLPALVGYIFKKPMQALENAENWGRLLCICEWMLAHPCHGLYIREMDVAGVHTKFVEANKKILSELLDLLLPPEAIDKNYTPADFEKRYGFKAKESVVRLRLPLDSTLFPPAISDISLTGTELAATQIPCGKILIVENQITFLALPRAPELLLILGAGYGFDALKKAEWLREKEIFYWGDIDTHGFAILSELRAAFPEACSILMDEETFREHRKLCVKEPKPVKYIPERLTREESALFEQLRAANGENLRLEQERICMSFALKKLREVYLSSRRA